MGSKGLRRSWSGESPSSAAGSDPRPIHGAADFATAIESTADLVVPSLTLFEVFKPTCQIADEITGLAVPAVMLQGPIVGLTAALAVQAARVSLETGLVMADSIILATAREHEATLWTQDTDSQGHPNVEYRENVAPPR